MKESSDEKIRSLCSHMSRVCCVHCTFLRCEPPPQTTRPTSGYCAGCTCEACEYNGTMLYGCSEAYRWNGKYVFYCPQGLTFVAASVVGENGSLTGGMLLGPIVMGDIEDTLLDIPDHSLHHALRKLTVWDAAKVNSASEILYAAALSVSLSAPEESVFKQDKLLSEIYRIKDELNVSGADCEFLISNEKKLCALIDAGDKGGARKLLNELLGYIYFTGSADLSALKVRLLELIVRLSRAAIDAGAEGREVLIFNENSITQLGKLNSADELSSWVTGIMNRFIMYCFDYAKAHHSDVLYKAMQYVKANYREKITLDDVASAIYLSRSYLCKVFKDEMGETLFSYINRIRVEKAKTLILDDSISIADVGGMCGFNDQSYFTKVFKSQTGVSPKKYRERRGRTA